MTALYERESYKWKARENLSYCLHIMAVCKEQIPRPSPLVPAAQWVNVSHPLLQQLPSAMEGDAQTLNSTQFSPSRFENANSVQR